MRPNMNLQMRLLEKGLPTLPSIAFIRLGGIFSSIRTRTTSSPAAVTSGHSLYGAHQHINMRALRHLLRLHLGLLILPLELPPPR